MDPVVFGKKRALLVRPVNNDRDQRGSRNGSRSYSRQSRHSEIIDVLRSYDSVRMWEKEENKWSYESFQNLKKTPYLLRYVPEKRNKKGYSVDCQEYFFLLTTLKNRRICCFIEKKKPLESAKIYQTRFRFKEDLFNGTLLSGFLTISEEMRSDERTEITDFFSQVFTKIKREVSAPTQVQNWIFVINDIWQNMGKDISSVLTQRIVMIQDIVGKCWYPDPKLDVCDFDLTIHNNYNEIEDFLRNKRKLFPYPISDHKVMCVCTQGIPGIDEYSISLKNPIPKPSMNETVVFRNGEWNVQNISHGRTMSGSGGNLSNEEKELCLKMSDFPDVYWVYSQKPWKKLGAARVRSIEESQCLKKLFSTSKDKDYVKLVCKWVQEFEKWQPILTNYI